LLIIYASDEFKKYERIYEKELTKIEAGLNEVFKGMSPHSLYDPCLYAVTGGGKRIRPFMVLLSGAAAGGRYEHVFNTALSVELFHNFTLVHDDIMDNADKRRGRKTVHLKYGVSSAILSGDNLIAVAYKYLMKDVTSNHQYIFNLFTDAIIEVCEGQSLDTDFERKKKVSIDEYKLMIKKKTAILLELCCKLGSAVVGADQGTTEALGAYGYNIGMAFQIQDDLLDIFGDEKQFGKTVGRDLLEGKKTYLILKAIEKSDVKAKKMLNLFITNKGIKIDQISEFKEMYKRLGVIEDAEKEIKQYTALAFEALNSIKEAEAKNILIWLGTKLLTRNN